MAWTSPRTWVAGETVTAALMNTHVRDNLKTVGDSWGSYTPTFGNVTLGNGTITARKSEAGKLVHFSLLLTVGSTTSITGTIQITLPVAPQAAAALVGTAHLFDTSAAARFNRFLSIQGGGLAGLGFTLRDLGHTAANATVPFTWANGDTLEVAGMYEAA